MSNIVFQSPDSFDRLLGNLREAALHPDLAMTDDLAVIKEEGYPPQGEKDFASLVEHVDFVFWKFFKENKWNFESHEYVPGRLFTRLERIAANKFGLSPEKAHEILRPFGKKVSAFLEQNLPSAVFVEKGTSLYSDRSPYYQEPQEKIMSCQVHAVNNFFGRRSLQVDAGERIDPPINADVEGIPIERIQQLTGENFIDFPVESCLNNPSVDKFCGSNGVHLFTYKKDKDGQWWKIDSLYKVNDVVFQVPVDLSQEKSKLVEIYFHLSQTETIQYLKDHIRSDLSTFNELNAQLEKILSSDEDSDFLDKLEKVLIEYKNCLVKNPVFRFQRFVISDKQMNAFFEQEQKERQNLCMEMRTVLREINLLKENSSSSNQALKEQVISLQQKLNLLTQKNIEEMT